MLSLRTNYNRGSQRHGGYPKTPPSPPLGPLVMTIRRSDIEDPADLERASAKITDCEFIASYNWLNQASPTVLIPGQPPLWTPLKQPVTLNEDSGSYFRDTNAARYPAYPNEAAARAIFTTNPAFNAADIDVFACGSTLGDLLRFSKNSKSSFRMLVEVVGKTVFLIRRENEATGLISDINGYGHTFPEAYTTWEKDVKGSLSHQRIVRYRFGGMVFLVRYEGDGYLGDQVGVEDKKGSASVVSPSTKDEDKYVDIDDLLDAAFRDTQLGEKSPATDGGLLTRRGGKEIPSKALFDLKTRAMWKDKDEIIQAEIPRLWIRQTANFILAKHSRGVFSKVQVIDIQNQVKVWESRNQEVLGRFVGLLEKIKDLALNHEGIMELRCRERDVIEVRRSTADVRSSLETATKAEWVAASENAANIGDLAHFVYDLDYTEDDNISDHMSGGYESEGSLSSYDYTACSLEDCGYCGRCPY